MLPGVLVRFLHPCFRDIWRYLTLGIWIKGYASSHKKSRGGDNCKALGIWGISGISSCFSSCFWSFIPLQKPATRCRGALSCLLHQCHKWRLCSGQGKEWESWPESWGPRALNGRCCLVHWSLIQLSLGPLKNLPNLCSTLVFWLRPYHYLSLFQCQITVSVPNHLPMLGFNIEVEWLYIYRYNTFPLMIMTQPRCFHSL